MTTRSDAPVELDGAAILANARALEPLLRGSVEAVERERRLVPAVVDALRAAGVFRMSMPRSWGGPELGLPEQVEIVEAVSRANGSAGWCVMIGSDSGFYSANLSDDVARQIWPDLDAVTAGWLFPVGRLERQRGGDGDDGTDGDGYRLSGRWSFASGCTHADVLVAGGLVWEGGAEQGAPVLGPDGLPEWRVAVVPGDAAEILDTWHTTGLAGSGSHDYEVAGCHVPAEHTWAFGGPPQRDGPLYAWPGAFLPNILGVPLGIARDAIDTAVPLLAAKLVMPDMTFAREDPRVRTAVARAEAQVGSARCYAYDVVGAFWDRLLAGDEPDLDSRAALAGCYVHVFQTCRAAVQGLYDIVGSAAVYRACPLDRHLRDMATIGQHILAQAKLFDAAGALWFGEDPGNPLL
jgi:alkylation response protein AidB-like acyl-CoA dehydrogenase